MRKIIIRMFAAAVVLAALLSCKKDEARPMDISGEWHLVSSDKVDKEEYGIDVYVVFNPNGRFELYQKISEGRYRYFSGTYALSGSHLTGSYSSGSPLASEYEASLENGGAELVLAASSGAETCRYVREAVPDEVFTGAVEFRSSGAVTSQVTPWL